MGNNASVARPNQNRVNQGYTEFLCLFLFVTTMLGNVKAPPLLPQHLIPAMLPTRTTARLLQLTTTVSITIIISSMDIQTTLLIMVVQVAQPLLL